MVWCNVVNTFIGMLALLGVYFAWKQLRLIREDQARQSEREAEDQQWSRKFTLAVQHLGKVVPRFFQGIPGPAPKGRPGGHGYHIIFQELEVRQNIAFLIDLDAATMKMKPRTLSVEQLRLPVVRETIQKVLDRIEETKQNDPELAARLGIAQGTAGDERRLAP